MTSALEIGEFSLCELNVRVMFLLSLLVDMCLLLVGLLDALCNSPFTGYDLPPTPIGRTD
jgi:hypothetical protein